LDVGADLALPKALATLYGRFQFPAVRGTPWVIANAVSTLDGVITLGLPGKAGGGPISGFNEHDRMVMGLLRAISDAVIVGAGTLRAVPHHVWTPDFVFPSLADEYKQLRVVLEKPGQPLNVIVTATGQIDAALPVFQRHDVSVLLATTKTGAKQLAGLSRPPSVTVAALADEPALAAGAILEAVTRVTGGKVILVEGGPRLFGDFFAEGLLDDLFLTLAPQVAGRDDLATRPGLIVGRSFAPDNPRWGTLIGAKRGGDHLFLRYSFQAMGN
jgi:riboflavin biosynthesis pyrimidine reductase